jgi:hypothetical protein
VVLLLKASDRIAHDLSALSEAASAAAAAGAPPPAPSLALRKWYDLRPEREFRCFVRAHELVAISQRDVSQRFPQLDGEAEALEAAICDFHDDSIAGRFGLADFTYDVYAVSGGRGVRLLDFNPVGGTTSALLFEWEELYGDGDAPEAAAAEGASGSGEGEGAAAAALPLVAPDVAFRIVTDAAGMRAGAKTATGMPYDMLLLQEGGGGGGGGSGGPGDIAASLAGLMAARRAAGVDGRGEGDV